MGAAIAGCHEGAASLPPQVASICLILQTPEEYVGRPLVVTARVFSSAGIDYAMLVDPACPDRGVKLVLDENTTGDASALVAEVNREAAHRHIEATLTGTVAIVHGIRKFNATSVSHLTVR